MRSIRVVPFSRFQSISDKLHPDTRSSRLTATRGRPWLLVTVCDRVVTDACEGSNTAVRAAVTLQCTARWNDSAYASYKIFLVLVNSWAVFLDPSKMCHKHFSYFLCFFFFILPIFSFADSVKSMTIDSRKVNVISEMHESKNESVVIPNESLKILSSCRKRAPIPLNGPGDRHDLNDDLHTAFSFFHASTVAHHQPACASTLVEAVIWFWRLIFSIGGALTFQSAVNSAVTRGWRGCPSMTYIGISLRIHIVLPNDVITIKKCLTWCLEKYTLFISKSYFATTVFKTY